jgi:hypothetical protein
VFSNGICVATGFHQVSISLLGIGIFWRDFRSRVQFLGNYLPKRILCIFAAQARFYGEHRRSYVRTPFAFVTVSIVTSLVGKDAPPAQVALTTAEVAAGVAFTLFLVNLILSFFLPEQLASDGDA